MLRLFGKVGADVGRHGLAASAVVLVAGVGLGGREAEVTFDPGQRGVSDPVCMLICCVATQASS